MEQRPCKLISATAHMDICRFGNTWKRMNQKSTISFTSGIFQKTLKVNWFQQVKIPLVPLYRNGLNSFLPTFGGHERQVKATSNFCEKNGCVLFHFQNKHSWTTADFFSKCEHPELTKKQIKSQEWLSPDSDAFMILQDIVISKTVLNYLKHLTQFSHTGTLEIYHALYNKWAPKFQHFSCFAW